MRLSSRGASRLRKAAKLKAEITLMLRGPDTHKVKLRRTAILRTPKR